MMRVKITIKKCLDALMVITASYQSLDHGITYYLDQIQVDHANPMMLYLDQIQVDHANSMIDNRLYYPLYFINSWLYVIHCAFAVQIIISWYQCLDIRVRSQDFIGKQYLAITMLLDTNLNNSNALITLFLLRCQFHSSLAQHFLQRSIWFYSSWLLLTEATSRPIPQWVIGRTSFNPRKGFPVSEPVSLPSFRSIRNIEPTCPLIWMETCLPI